MASLLQKNGLGVIQFVASNGKRPKIRLGRLNKKQSEAVKLHVEDLIYSQRAGTSPKNSTAEWVSSLQGVMRKRLERVGLVKPVAGADCPVFASWVRQYVSSRSDVKLNTLRNFEQVCKSIEKFFGQKKICEIMPEDAYAYRGHLKERGFAESTVRWFCKKVRQFLRAAIKRKFIADNPFTEMPCSDYANPERQRFIERETIQAVLDACPDAQWRLIVALSRFGGLRCPSEVLGLTWDKVDWEKMRFTVHATKTEHLADGGNRVVPLFPELLPYMMDVFEQAHENDQYVITRYHGEGKNLRTQFQRILARAGVESWPRLFHNMRASRQTELELNHPGYVVAKWMGNSESIARKHYLMVTEDHFRAAVSSGAKSGAVGVQNGVQKAEQHQAAPNRTESHDVQNPLEIKAHLRLSAQKCGPVRKHRADDSYPQGESNPCLQDENLIS